MTTWTDGRQLGPGWLFCPADRPDRYAKAAAMADVVILDLEDAVAPADKVAARAALAAHPLDPVTTVVRVNAVGTEDHALDLQALAATDYTGVMVPKCETADQLRSLAPRRTVALIETPLGALQLAELASAENVIGLMWGSEDLMAALGGKSSRYADGRYRDVARSVRSSTLLTAKARGLFALDSVYLDVNDGAGLQREADDAVASGFDGKVAIHPRQVDIIRTAFAPTPAEVEWARTVLEQAATERGVFLVGGQMVDAPVLRRANDILIRADLATD